MYTAALPAVCSGGTYRHNHSTQTYTAHRMYTAALPAACSGGTYRHNHSTYTAHRMYTAAPQQPAAAGHTVTITVHRHTLHTGCTPRPHPALASTQFTKRTPIPPTTGSDVLHQCVGARPRPILSPSLRLCPPPSPDLSRPRGVLSYRPGKAEALPMLSWALPIPLGALGPTTYLSTL